MYSCCLLWIAGFGVIILQIQIGAFLGWTINLGELKYVTKDSERTYDEIFGIYFFVGKLAGILTGGYMIQFYGSKKSIFSSAIPFIASWILMIFINITSSLLWFYISKIIVEFGIGMTCVIFPIFCAEITNSKNRGILFSIISIGIPLTPLTISSVLRNSQLTFFSSVIFLIISLLGITNLSELPDTPYNLIKLKNFTKAKESLQCYRGKDIVDDELEVIKKYMSKNKIFKNFSFIKNLLVIVILFMYMEIIRISVLYFTNIFLNKNIYLLNSLTAFITIPRISSITFSFLWIFLIERFKRRLWLLIFNILISVSFIMIIVYYVKVSNETDTINDEYLPIISVTLLYVSVNAGLFTILNMFLGEIFPSNIKGIVSSIVNVFILFVNVFSLSLINFFFESHEYFFVKLFVLLIIPFVILPFIPETKGKTLLEIQEKLKYKKEDDYPLNIETLLGFDFDGLFN